MQRVEMKKWEVNLPGHPETIEVQAYSASSAIREAKAVLVGMKSFETVILTRCKGCGKQIPLHQGLCLECYIGLSEGY